MKFEHSTRHLFMPGHTITAAIKLYNGYNLTLNQMTDLMFAFNELNGGKLPKPGNNFKIPLLEAPKDK